MPRVASTADRALAAAVETHQREAAVIDTRLGREITLAVKAMALSDLCSRLKEETGIRLDAGASVADEKVTLFCEKRPLREVMQQLCRPFGYTWLRTRRPALGSGLWALGSGPGTGGRLRTEGPRDSPGSSRSEPGPPLRGSPAAVRFEAKARQGPLPQSPEPRADYSYELVQDLRSQLLEEELRNRDRREALLALDREMQRYRPYLSLSPDEARARAAAVRPSGGTGSLPVSGRAGGEVAALGEKALLENLAGYGWGPVQLYFRLSPPDLARLRAGESLKFSAEPKEGEQLLPDTIGRGVLPALGDWRVRLQDGRPSGIGFAKNLPDGLPLASVPEVRVTVTLALNTRELGQSALSGSSGVRVGGMMMADGDRLAIGVSPTVRHPGNKRANAGLAGDSALRPHISFQPQPSCRPGQTNDERPRTNEEREPPDVGGRSPGAGVVVVGRRATSADVLEALHRATGMSLVADYYTRLYPVDAVSVQAATLFEALNHVSDAMHLRWQKDGAWLQFRSAGYYDDRFKEVPNRLLHRWAAARREHGALPLEDLLEIAQLTDAQLDSNDMAEGARDCFGLIEWALAQHGTLRQHAPFLAHLTPAQRQEAQGVAGLPFARMTLAQQQEFLSHVPFPKEETGVGPRALRGHPTPVGPHGESRAYSLAELVAPASLRVEYAQPGWFRWVAPDGPNDRPDRPSRQLSPIRERTREAALLAARRLDPKVPEEQILPSDLALRVQYSLGSRPTGGSTLLVSVTPSSSGATTHTFEPEGAARQPAGAP